MADSQPRADHSANRSKVSRSLRHAIRQTIGLWPAFEMRNKALGWPGALTHRRFQVQETSRLRPHAGVRAARVLVVIPTFRRPDLLQEAVDSALSQSFADLSVVVVDDGGGLPHLPESPKLSAVSLRRNTGTAAVVRNVGVGLGESEMIAFLDDDNVWHGHHLATALDALDADPSLSAVYTSIERVLPDGTVHDILGEPFKRARLKDEAFVDINSVVVRRSRHVPFSAIPRSRGMLPLEDWEYIWRLSRSGEVKHVDDVTVTYRINPQSYFSDWSRLT